MASIRVIEHPILGFLALKGSSEVGLTALEFHKTRPEQLDQDDSLLQLAESYLQRYLWGERVDFSDLPLHPEGTPFQRKVWSTLMTIPWGETRSYKWVAEQLGKPSASRAIGQANGKNPIPIIIPCHRVIQHGGGMGGYTGGLHIKHFLLSLEQHSSTADPLELTEVLRPTKIQAMTLL